MSMNGYDLSHKFYEWAFENRRVFKPAVPALYFYLVEVCNKLGWKKEFSISSKECMEGMGVSAYNTYKEAFDILCDNGLITIVKKSCNHHQANIISLSNFNRVDDEVANKVNDKVTTEYSESSSNSNCDIHKTNKTVKPLKTNKTVKQGRISKQEDKKEYAEFVSMIEDEYMKLVEAHTKEGADRMIQILNNYKGSTGKKYKSDYLAILNWVVGRYKEELQKGGANTRQLGASYSSSNFKDTISTYHDTISLDDSQTDNYTQKDYSERF